MLERRKEQRVPAYLVGKVSWGAYQFRANCLVQNVSTRGAKLVLQFATMLPVEFRLVIPPNQLRNLRGIGWIHVIFAPGYECEVEQRWRIGKAFGVELANCNAVTG